MSKNNKSACSKDLVIWGTNLYSTVRIKLSQNELNIVKLSYFIKSVIIGILLSDGYIIFSTRSKNGRLGLTQSLSNSAYLYFAFNILAHYCPRYPIFTERFRFGKPLYSLEIVTRSMSCITELHTKFYVNKIKIIKPSIYNDLTPIALAHWIMGDGTFNGITLYRFLFNKGSCFIN
jgi:LAGLIDADG DNA endonuclease family